MSLVEKIFGSFSDRELKKINPIAKKVLDLEPAYAAMSDSELQAQTPALKERLAKGETLDDILPEAFATCREAAWRVLGMKHFPVQVVGGIALHRANIAEMQTGEGKTLVATLPAYLNALSGEGVHVVTVNDYLAKRDSEWMGKLYRWLGLTVGLIVPGLDGAARRKAYNADITYGTNNEFGFDYLRDNMVTYKANMVQRGHAYAIVDEVDSILIDEARTPLIISGRGEDSSSLYTQVDQFVRTLRKSVVVELESKEEADDQADGDYVVDEKHKTATLTASGIKKAEEYFKVENLAAAENMTLVHHIEQAIKAHGVMKKDIDYVVKDGEVIIVDEFTGRLMIGRRYNEGLHQAIEAKEGVHIASESKTLATITFQNYFRMYKKLAGMTGTARTEATEFTEIYGLNIVTVPTNKPNIRKDYPDVVYSTVAGKYRAVIDQVMECHAKGQPVLVGTVSVEKSEILAKMLQKRTKDFNVLNAKNHEREAEIVAQAGKKGAITIATNMAGRGTDIMLGGNAEFMAKAQMRKEQFCEKLLNPEAPQDALPEQVEALLIEADGHGDTTDANILAARARFDELYRQYKDEIAEEAEEVRAAGGLFIIGTERHESRRIDNQLRGRAGRQGDPGVTQFYLSLEDDLMRLFGGNRMDSIARMMEKTDMPEDMPIQAGMVSKAIEGAQRQVESMHFAARKNVLEYDDVMNLQRAAIYAERNAILDGKDMEGRIPEIVRDAVSAVVEENCPAKAPSDDWDVKAVETWVSTMTGSSDFSVAEVEHDDDPALLEEAIAEHLEQVHAEKAGQLGEQTMRMLESQVMLRIIDTRWMAHLQEMDYLKAGIGLRAFGQRDPLVEYKNEAYNAFQNLTAGMYEDYLRTLLRLQVAAKPEQPALAEEKSPLDGKVSYSSPEQALEQTGVAAARQRAQAAGARAQGAPAAPPKPAPAKPQTYVKDKDDPFANVGRNDPCPCGSGLKYKKCHGRDQ